LNLDVIVEQLKKDEGFSPISFWDFKQWTWGYGTKAPGVDFKITKEDAEIELREKTEEAIEGFRRLFGATGVEINEVREHALVNMIFNLGYTGVKNFKNTLAAIYRGNWPEAAHHARNSLWYRQVTRRARRICNELERGVVRNGV